MTRTFKFADAVLLGSGLMLVGGAVYLAVAKQSHLQRPLDIALLVFVPVLLAATLFATFRLQPATRAKVALMVVSGTLTLYAAEAFLLWDPMELRGLHPNPGFDQRDYPEVVLALRAAGSPAYPVVSVANWFDSPPIVSGVPVTPLAGIPQVPIVLCNETGTYVVYESDRFGFNNPDDVWDMPLRVALVGDSFTEGWCVPREESFAALIRRRYGGTVNLGYSGHGPLIELGTIREFIAVAQPAIVFWFFYEGNDLFRDLPREMENALLRRYLEPGFTQHLRQHSMELGEEMRRRVDARLAAWKPAPPESPVTSIVTLRGLRGLSGIGTARAVERLREAQDPLTDLRSILADAKRTVEGWGGSLYFVYLPDLSSAIGSRSPAAHDEVLTLVAGVGLPVIDLTPVFNNQPDPRQLFPWREGRHLINTRGLHYNAEGHRLVADHVLTAIERDGR